MHEQVCRGLLCKRANVLLCICASSIRLFFFCPDTFKKAPDVCATSLSSFSLPLVVLLWIKNMNIDSMSSNVGTDRRVVGGCRVRAANQLDSRLLCQCTQRSVTFFPLLLPDGSSIVFQRLPAPTTHNNSS